MTNHFSLVALMSVLMAAGGAAQTAAPRPATAAPGTAQSGGVEVPADYVIGLEDVLGVVFWREADLSGDVTVRPDGRITLPVLGEMVAAGLKPLQLQQQIQAAAGKYIQDPNVAVVVRTINSRKIFVTGRVNTPGTYDLRGTVTIMQAIALAGGLTEYADAKKITVLRKRGSQTEVLKFNYRDVAKGKDLEQNVPLLPGDTVVVP